MMDYILDNELIFIALAIFLVCIIIGFFGDRYLSKEKNKGEVNDDTNSDENSAEEISTENIDLENTQIDNNASFDTFVSNNFVQEVQSVPDASLTETNQIPIEKTMPLGEEESVVVPEAPAVVVEEPAMPNITEVPSEVATPAIQEEQNPFKQPLQEEVEIPTPETIPMQEHTQDPVNLTDEVGINSAFSIEPSAGNIEGNVTNEQQDISMTDFASSDTPLDTQINNGITNDENQNS